MKRRHPGRKRVLRQKLRYSAPACQLFVLTFLMLSGVLTGALLVKNSTAESLSDFSFFLQSAFAGSSVSTGFFSVFSSSFFSSALPLCLAFFLGLCAAGAPVLFAVPLFSGVGIGYTMAFLYLKYGGKGIAFCAVCLLPYAVLSSIAVIFSCREGVRYSLKLFRAISPSAGELRLWEPFLEYCRRFVAYFVLILIAALLETATTLIMSGFLS